jgi:hypothetical protein
MTSEYKSIRLKQTDKDDGGIQYGKNTDTPRNASHPKREFRTQILAGGRDSCTNHNKA